ncbi:TPA: PIG-L family deacetylase, partial [Streptococcus pneumoniae]|nr:PIG-L family deacetylase [Streptococcus pneumoniae]
MSNNTKYIFLSPHLDDAIFSCGDYISKLTSEGEIVLVITIFSGYPLSQQLQPSAKQFHKLCNLGKYPIEERKKEDRLACERLQCDFRHLSYYECLYRKDRNGNFLYRHIYSELKNEDTLKNDIIKELLMHLDDKCVVYCPLSLGDHIDHVFVNSIGRALEFMRYKVIYYEDFPYVSDSSMVSYMGK